MSRTKPAIPKGRPSRPARALLGVLRALRLSILGLFLPRAVAQPVPIPESAVSDDVFYQIMPLAWRDSDGDALPDGTETRFGDFRGMTDSLQYLQAMGITAVWMTPIFPSPAYHGYQHGPADRLNPRLGTDEDWLGFVREAHARGIKVFIDFVAYGVSTDSEYFKDACQKPASPYDSWLAFTDEGNTQYAGYTYKTWDGTSVGFIHWDLNRPEVRELVSAWARKWLDPDADGNLSDGVDGFRLDHVWVKYKDSPPSTNGWGYNLDSFWRPWKESLAKVNPRVFTFAEQAQWETTGAGLLAPDDTGRRAFDAAFTKPFEGAAREAIRSGKAAQLREVMRRMLKELPARKATDGTAGTYLAILGDHDVDRIASVVEGRDDPPGTDFPLDAGTNSPRCKLMAAILLTQPFPPVIYMGDEIGMRGVRQKYGGDANDIPVREPFKWTATAGPPMSNYWAPSRQAVDNAYSRDNDGRSVEEQERVPGSLLEEYRYLIFLRRRTPSLRHGSYQEVPSGEQVWSFVRRDGEQGQAILVALNLSGARVPAELDLTSIRGAPGGTLKELATGRGTALTPVGVNGKVTIELPAYGYSIMELKPD